MKLAMAICVAALAAAVIGPAATQAAPVARSAAAPPCSPTTTTIDGGPAISYCGPATATLTVGGKTYAFKGGYCQSIHVSAITLDVTLGTIVEGKSGEGVHGNAGKPSFRLDLSPGRFSSILDATFSGGKNLTSGGTVSFSGSATSKGTFKSANTPGGSATPFSGSWNCHGVFVKN
jgi:hypothetical protein